MKLKLIGEMQKGSYNEFESIEPIDVKFLGCEVPIIIDELTDESYIPKYEEAIKNFLNLKTKDKKNLCKYLFEYYNDEKEHVDDIDLEVEKPNEIFEYVTPHLVILFILNQEVYVFVEAECEWNPEDGVSFIYKNGCELVKVSAYDGLRLNDEIYGNKIYVSHDDMENVE